MKKLAFVTAAAALAGCCSAPQPAAPKCACSCCTRQTYVKADSPSLRKSNLPFKLGFAGYTFYKLTTDEMLSLMKRIDAHYLCIKPNFIDYGLGADAPIAAFKAKCAAAGVECLGAGPLYYDNEESARKLFEFAKAYGIKTVVVVPWEPNREWKQGMDPKAKRIESDKMLDVLDRLVKEFDICAAIHNHGPDTPVLYPTAEAALKRIGNRDKRIGVCLDVGHERRAGLDPVDFIRKHGDRVYDVHLKNIKIDPVQNFAKEGPRGELDIAGIFAALAEVGYSGVCHIEYEKDFQDNLAEVAESFGYYRGLMDATHVKARQCPVPAGANTLTDLEKAEGYELLFDGKNLPADKWIGEKEKFAAFPKSGWYVEDGTLYMKPRSGISPEGKWFPLPPEDARLGGGGSIVTVKKYRDFCFKFDFRLTWAANSGIKYYYDETVNKGGTCEEYQVLEAGHPDSTKGKNGNRRVASLYDLIPANADKIVKPTGQWNSGMIIAKGRHVEHWLNGVKVLEYERGSEDFRKLVAESKYANWGVDKDGKPQPWGEVPVGRIHIQDHSDSTVYYCNLKIKEL